MRNKSFHVDNEIYDLATLWMLRAIFRAGGEREFLRCRYDNVLEFLDVSSSEPTKQDIEALKNRLDVLEKTKISCKLKDLEHNLNLLQSNLGLNDAEKTILRFVAIIFNYEVVCDA